MAMLDGTDSDRDTEAGDLVDRLSSSSLDLSSEEISTMRVEIRCCFECRPRSLVAGGHGVLPYNPRKHK